MRETRAISEILSPSYFVEAQIFPYSYQNMPLRGNATKIDALFLREYLHQRRAVPYPGEGRDVAGGFTDMEYQGAAQPRPPLRRDLALSVAHAGVQLSAAD